MERVPPAPLIPTPMSVHCSYNVEGGGWREGGGWQEEGWREGGG